MVEMPTNLLATGTRWLKADSKEWILCGPDGTVAKIGERGTLVWQRETDIALDIMPVVAGDFLVAAMQRASNCLVAIELNSGRSIWTNTFPSSLHRMAASGKSAIIAYGSEQVCCLEVLSGRKRWETNLADSVVAQIIAGNSNCLVGLQRGTLLSLRLSDGHQSWATELGESFDGLLSARNANIVAVSQSNTVFALEAGTGTVRWKHRLGIDDSVQLPMKGIRQLPLITALRVLVVGLAADGNVRVLDLRSGRLRYAETTKGSPDLPLLDLGRFAVFFVGETDENIIVFDGARDFIVRRDCLPANLNMVAHGGRDVVFEQDGHAGVAQLDAELLASIEEGTMPFLTKEFVPAALLIGLLIFSLPLFALAGRPKLPPTYETSLHLAAIAVVVVGICVLCLVAGASAIHPYPGSHSIAHAIGIALCGMPAMLLLFYYSVWPKWQVRRLLAQHQNHPCSRTDSAIVAAVNSLAAEMQLPFPVKVLFSDRGNLSPLAFGVSPREAVILVPHNLEDLALRACRGNGPLAGGLLKLVLAHELAHVRNGDLWALPLLVAVNRWLPALAGIGLLFLWSSQWIENGSLLQTWLRPAIMAFAGGVSVAWLLLKKILRNREQLADATATLYVPPATVQMLGSSTSADPLSPLERLIVGLSSNSILSQSCLGFTFPTAFRGGWSNRLWGNRPTALGQFRRRMAQRVQVIRTKAAAIPADVVPSPGASLAIGAVGAFALLAAMAIASYSSPERPMPTQPNQSANLETASWFPLSIDHQSTNAVYAITTSVCPPLVAFIMIAVLLVPLRDSGSSLHCLPRHDLYRLAGRFTLTQAAFVATSLCLGMLMQSAPLEVVFALIIPILTVGFLGLLAVATFGFALTSRGRISHWRAGEVAAGIGTVAAAMMLSLAGCVIVSYGSSLSTLGILSWWAVLGLLSWQLKQLRLLRITKPELEFPQEAMRVRQGWGANRLVIHPLGTCLPMNRQALQWMIMDQLLVVVLLPVLFFALLVPFLSAMDISFLARYGELQTAAWVMAAQAPHRMATDRIGYLAELSPLMASRFLLGPTNFLPSTMLGLALVGTCALARYGVLAAGSLRGRAHPWLQLHNRFMLLELDKLLPGMRVREQLRAGIDQTLQSEISRECPCLTSKERIPMMKTTCQFLQHAHRLQVADARLEWMVDWILSCELAEGGFGAAPGMKADLLHTVNALQALRTINRGPHYDVSRHERWLMRKLCFCIRSRESLHRMDFAGAVTLCLMGLDALGALPRIQRRRRIIQATWNSLLNGWHRGRQTPEEVYILLQCMQHLNIKSDSVRMAITREWLPRWEKLLPTIKADSELHDLVHSILVLRLLFPETYHERPSVVQIADHLVKAFNRAQPPVNDEQGQAAN